MTRGGEAPTTRRLAVGAAAVVPLLVGAALATRLWSGQSYVYLYDFPIPALVFSILGVLILRRRPGQIIGRLFVALGVVWSVTILLGSGALALDSGALALGAIAARMSAFALGGFVFLLFPTGSLPSPAWRVVGWMLAAGIVLTWAGILVSPGPIEDIPRLTNPIGFVSVGVQIIGIGLVLLIGMGVVPAVLSTVVRWRGASGDEQQQVKLFAFAVATSAGLIIVANLAFPTQMETTALGHVVWGVPMVVIPAAVAIAIVRYRLYDIDRVISRTVGYGLVVGLMIGVYTGSVVFLQAFLPERSDLAVAASTLAAAALFNPLHRKVQRLVDRRFYRSRYDAQQVVEGFSARLRDEVRLEDLTTDFLGVVQETMQPSSVSVWVKEKV